jgi:hypothetical protein
VASPRAIVELSVERGSNARSPLDAATTLLDALETLTEPIVRVLGRDRSVGLLGAILFLRLAEERGLEPPGSLRELTRGQGLGPRLAAHLAGAAARYGIEGLAVSFRGRPADERLRDLLLFLYSSANARAFSSLSPDTLGRVYERSVAETDARRTRALGKTRTLARKTHGVFYTPSHVVDYVVERTLGRVLDDQERKGRARVLDPACGSGAFLLGAYRRLLDWHLRAHVDGHRERTARGETALLVRSRAGELRLRRAARSAILQDSIFGVDVDAVAVDVAKLSLLLACFDEPCEGEPIALPRLGPNVRAGHSLIDAAGLEGTKPFCWPREFPEVFAEGGFDVVIGNPPYLSFGGRHAVDIPSELRRYYAEHYESGGWPTAHSLFLERSVKLLSRRFISFVVPDQVGHLGGYQSARAIAQREAGLVEVRYWGERVFHGVTTPALTVVLDKANQGGPTEIVDRDGAARRVVLRPGEPWTSSLSAGLLERLRRDSFSLGKLVGDCGIRTTSSKEQVVEWSGPERNVVPVLEGKLIGRYGCRPPRIAVRLDSAHPLFMSRPERYRDATFVIRQTASYPIVGPREHALYFRNSLLALFSPSDGLDVRYLVALLNSKLLRFVYCETVREARQRAFPQVKVRALQSLPLRKLDLARDSDQRRHDAIVLLAQTALETQRRAVTARRANEQHSLARDFEAIDRHIDDLVYDLYELSSEERDTVEKSLARAMS